MKRSIFFGALLLTVGCVGTIGGDEGGKGGPSSGTGAGLGTSSSPLCASGSDVRRLSARQYARAIQDLFDGKVQPSPSYPIAGGASRTGYTTEAPLYAPSAGSIKATMQAAEDVAEGVSKALADLLPCSTSGTPGDDCAKSFIATYARRAYRRTPTDAEASALLDAFHAGITDGASFSESIALVVAEMLETPHFLYVVEDAAADKRALSSVEMASRLSFLLWDSIPDDALLDAAEKGTLQDPAALGAQAERLLASPKADTTLARFVREWTGTTEVSAADKDAKTFPDFDNAKAQSMNDSFDKFAVETVRADGTLSDLLLSKDAWVDTNMAALFGVAAPTQGTWQKVTLDDKRYAGVMTQPALLASLAHSSSSSYVYRGRFVRKRMLCETFGPPPANAQTIAAGLPLPPHPTAKETAAKIESQPACASCHKLLDPAGLAFEHFDAIGAWRDTYASGRAIDPSGALPGVDGATIDFQGPTDLLEHLASEPATARCFAHQAFRFAMSREETDADQCSIDALEKAMASSDGTVKGLLLAVVQMDAFRAKKD